MKSSTHQGREEQARLEKEIAQREVEIEKNKALFNCLVLNKFLNLPCQGDAHLAKQIPSICQRRSIWAQPACKTTLGRAAWLAPNAREEKAIFYMRGGGSV